MSFSYSVLRTDEYHNVRVRVPLLPEIGKRRFLRFLRGLHFSKFRSKTLTYFSASVTGTLDVIAVIQ